MTYTDETGAEYVLCRNTVEGWALDGEVSALRSLFGDDAVRAQPLYAASPPPVGLTVVKTDELGALREDAEKWRRVLARQHHKFSPSEPHKIK